MSWSFVVNVIDYIDFKFGAKHFVSFHRYYINLITEFADFECQMWPTGNDCQQ